MSSLIKSQAYHLYVDQNLAMNHTNYTAYNGRGQNAINSNQSIKNVIHNNKKHNFN